MADGDFILAPGEEYQQCPYSLAHRITNARFIVHLDKCRRNYIKTLKETGERVKMVECRFNYLHQMPSPEVEYHESKCPDQYRVVSHLQYHQSDEFKSSMESEKKRKEGESEERNKERRHHRSESSRGDVNQYSSKEPKKKHSKRHRETRPAKEDNPWGSDAEDWETESKGYEAGYDPAEKLEKDVFLYHPRGLSKSERKAFRKDQKVKAEARSPSPEIVEVVDIKPFSRLDVNDQWNNGGRDYRDYRDYRSRPESSGSGSGLTATSTRTVPPPPPPPVVKPEPVQWNDDGEKEDGEISEEEFYGEDPFA